VGYLAIIVDVMVSISTKPFTDEVHALVLFDKTLLGSIMRRDNFIEVS
jgi:hypothetical protein